jgi:hypothetical protein
MRLIEPGSEVPINDWQVCSSKVQGTLVVLAVK